MKYGKFVVNGSTILLFGTDHQQVDDSYDPTSHPAYAKLRRFHPSTLFIELDQTDKLSNHTDVADGLALRAYIDSHNPRVIKYDREPELDLLSYSASWAKGKRDEFEQNADDRNLDEKRKLLNEGNPTLFSDAYADREDHASSVFLERLTPGTKTAIHCGRDHYPAYKRLFNFLP